MTWLYSSAVFLSAFLLFALQPAVGHLLLPWFGGAPAVWTVCMLFFQAFLLLGYLYAHLLVSRLSPRAQALVHLTVLGAGLAALLWAGLSYGAPLRPPPSLQPRGGGQPTFEVLAALAAACGLPYFGLSANGPLLQAWFARANPGKPPYRLYALSNAGSFLALIAYPFAIDPLLSVRAQGWGMLSLFALFAGAAAVLGQGASRSQPLQLQVPAPNPSSAFPADPGAFGRALWLALPATSSALLLAVSSQMTEEVTAVPFLWVLPLALYLASFILTFESERWYRRGVFAVLFAGSGVAVSVLHFLGNHRGLSWQLIPLPALLFAGAMLCHGELARLRPPASGLTGFYLRLSLGSAAGAALVALAAPRLLTTYLEVPIAVSVCWALLWLAMAREKDSALRRYRSVRTAVPALVGALLVMLWSAYTDGPDHTLLVRRGFFGVLRVVQIDPGSPEEAVALIHGQTTHGMQFQAEKLRSQPTTYYGASSGVGHAILEHPRRQAGQPMKVGVVGLGAGTLGGWALPGDQYRFYEIDPLVVDLAKGEGGYFSFLSGCQGQVEVVLGDGRVALESELAQPQGFDVLALDAFSSDAIPAHLLTKEALEIYLRHLRDADSVLAIHVSNRLLDLSPVVARLARELGLKVSRFKATKTKKTIKLAGELPSDWMLLARARVPEGEVPEPSALTPLWTDDHVDLLSALR